MCLQKTILHVGFVTLLSLSIKVTVELLHSGEGRFWPKMVQTACKLVIPSPALLLPSYD